MSLDSFNALPEAAARARLLDCCAAPRWAGEVAAGRPYASVEALHAAARDALTDADVTAGLAGHPRIGDRSGDEQSRREQRGVAGADADLLAALATGNRAYEQRFGYVYLVCASGRGAGELLEVLHGRLGNDPATERDVVRTELAAINRLRLDRLLGALTPSGAVR